MGCRRCLISGRVQGVFYRASAQQRALELGLTGSASNLMNGWVEVYMCGDEQQLDDMETWLRQGPVHAKVEHVVCEAIPEKTFTGFETG